MKRIKINLNEERQILINMITNTSFLRQVYRIIKPSLFQAVYSRIISEWIFEYYEKTDKAPDKDLQDLYLRKKHEIDSEDDLELISDFLQSLSDEYEENKINNITYAVHNAIKYFKLRSLENIKDRLENCIDNKEVDVGERIIANFTRLEKPHGSGVDLFRDHIDIQEAFDSVDEYMFSFPGVLGEAIGNFQRGDFFAIIASVKRGKSFWLWYTARRAVLMGFKAIFFSLEMTQNQIVRRAWQSFLGEPVKGGIIKMSKFKKVDNDKFEIIYDSVKKKGVKYEEIKKYQEKYRQQLIGSELRIEIYPSYATTLTTIKTCLENLEYYDNFVPDVIVIDYADILKPESKDDHRHQLNNIWATLRGWAQERNCLVVTASQTGRKSISRDAGSEDIAEDVRKLAHVTKMISLNQNEKEREQGILRVQPLLNRDGKMSYEQVVVLENRDISRIYLDSQFKSKVVINKE